MPSSSMISSSSASSTLSVVVSATRLMRLYSSAMEKAALPKDIGGGIGAAVGAASGIGDGLVVPLGVPSLDMSQRLRLDSFRRKLGLSSLSSPDDATVGADKTKDDRFFCLGALLGCSLAVVAVVAGAVALKCWAIHSCRRASLAVIRTLGSLCIILRMRSLAPDEACFQCEPGNVTGTSLESTVSSSSSLLLSSDDDDDDTGESSTDCMAS
mmetsp:Transcript_1886/g.5504  ORF Transcript_1886/g.5504 Transcript_1886/m.5504 type:complete len:212 (+) Transcript_1886:2203-2838(+)